MNQTSPQNSAYRLEIDGLRALAVLCVVVFHFFPSLLEYGYLGVDIFFVISGFLISTHLLGVEGESISAVLKSFYKRRIKRLFPALFFFLALTHIFISKFYLPIDVTKFEDSLLASYTFWANFYFWRDGGYFGGNDQLKPLLHIWSLSVEEQFYLCFPIFLIVSLKLRRSFRLSSEISVLLITFLSFVLWYVSNYIGGANPAFFLLPTRIWQFGIGALLAVFAHRCPCYSVPTRFGKALFSSSIIAIVAAFLLNVGAEVQTLLVTLGAAGFIAFSSLQNSFLLSIFRSGVAVFVGKISYSLYLYHWPVAVALTYYFVDGIPIFFSVIGVVASVLLGYLSFKLVENPFRSLFNFNHTLYFLCSCLLLTAMAHFLAKKEEPKTLANTIAQASGTHFRCDVSSYRPYGSSRACVINKAERANGVVALLGNSHAQMYAPMVSGTVPEKYDLLLVPLNGCLPTTSINISDSCMRMANTNLDMVLSDEQINVVVVATTWYEGSYIESNGNEVDRLTLKDSVGDLVKKIDKSGKLPVLLSPLAIPEKDYASELARKLRFNQLSEQEVLDTIKVSRSKYDNDFKEINAHFKMLMGETYIRVYDDLCDEKNCFFGSEELFYFADGSHLSEDALSSFVKSKAQLLSVLSQLE